MTTELADVTPYSGGIGAQYGGLATSLAAAAMSKASQEGVSANAFAERQSQAVGLDVDRASTPGRDATYPARNDRWNAAIVLRSLASARRPRCEMTFTGWRVP